MNSLGLLLGLAGTRTFPDDLTSSLSLARFLSAWSCSSPAIIAASLAASRFISGRDLPFVLDIPPEREVGEGEWTVERELSGGWEISRVQMSQSEVRVARSRLHPDRHSAEIQI